MFELVEFFLLVVVQDLADLFVRAVPPDGPTRRSPGQPDRAFLPWNNWVAAHYYYPDSVRPASRSGNQGRYPNRPLLHSNPALLVILPPSSMKKCPITDVSVPLITFKIPPRLRSDREREKGRSSPL